MVERRGGGAVASRCAARATIAAALALLAVHGEAAAETVRRAPGKLSGGSFEMPRAGAEQYGASPWTCASGGALSLLEGELGSQVKNASGIKPKADGPLCAVAEAFMGWSDPQTPPESVTRFVAWHFGASAPIRNIVMATIETEDPRIIVERLFETAAAFSARAVAPRFGLATYRVRREATKVVMVLQDVPFELKAVPRRVASGATVAVEGRLVGGLDGAKVLASDPVGKLETVPAKGAEFRAQLACGPRPGRMQIEIRAESRGDAAVASFPVACGSEFPNSVPVPPSGKLDPAQEARKLLELTNRDRAGAGVRPLEWDDAVAGVAQSAAEYLRDAAAGRPGRAFDLQAKLNAVDVASPLVLQNPVAAPGADEAHALLVTSPVDRSNLLNPEATHSGVGAVAASAGGAPAIYFAELLVKELPPFDAAAVATKLRAEIGRRRADARAAPLADDPVLDEVAGRYAAALAEARGKISSEKDREITAPLYKGFRTVNVISGVKSDPLEFAEEPGIVGDAKLVGVGVAKGTSASLGRNSAFVVVITGSHHEQARPQGVQPKDARPRDARPGGATRPRSSAR